MAEEALVAQAPVAGQVWTTAPGDAMKPQPASDPLDPASAGIADFGIRMAF